jgi:hypothetical protein
MVFGAALCAAMLAARSTSAQRSPAPRRGTPRGQQTALKIRGFTGLGTRNHERTPGFRTDKSGGTVSAKKWYKIGIEYDTTPEWIDQMTVQFFALCGRRVENQVAYTFFTTSGRYWDVEEGRRHKAEAFLHPKAESRYGDVVAVAVTVEIEGEVVASESAASIKLPENWWRNPRVTDNESVTRRDGYLMERSRSPFALINIDDYEFVK